MLGTLNALALTGLSGLRAFTPALFTSIFALGANTQFLGGYLVWVILVILVILEAGFTVATRYLPEASEKDFPASPLPRRRRCGKARPKLRMKLGGGSGRHVLACVHRVAWLGGLRTDRYR